MENSVIKAELAPAVLRPMDSLIYNHDNSIISTPRGNCFSNGWRELYCLASSADDGSTSLARIDPLKKTSFYIPLIGFPVLYNSATAVLASPIYNTDSAILSFGGSSLDGTIDDTNLYLIDPMSYTWKTLPPSNLAPSPRRGACLVEINQENLYRMRERPRQYLLLFGEGQDENGDTILYDDVWRASIDPKGGNSVIWEKLLLNLPYKSAFQTCHRIKRSSGNGPGNWHSTDVFGNKHYGSELTSDSIFVFGGEGEINDTIFEIVVVGGEISRLEEFQGIKLPPFADPVPIHIDSSLQLELFGSKSTLILASGTDSNTTGYYTLDLCDDHPKWNHSLQWQVYDHTCQGRIDGKVSHHVSWSPFTPESILYLSVFGVLLIIFLWYVCFSPSNPHPSFSAVRGIRHLRKRIPRISFKIQIGDQREFHCVAGFTRTKMGERISNRTNTVQQYGSVMLMIEDEGSSI
jgi:hypothetical protein